MSTDLAWAIRPDDILSLASSVARVLGRERASRELMVSEDELDLVQSGSLDEVTDVTLMERLAAWATVRNEELFRATGSPIPPFDHLRDFWVNFYEGPRSEPIHQVQRKVERTKLLDFELNFPFGVPACALTPHSRYIDFFARRGFDLLTYKTVRDRPWNPHPFPHWAFAVDAPEQLTPADFNRPVVATLDQGIRPEARTVLANSFGVPSLAPNEWQEDIEEAKRRLGAGQVLIVSVMGTPEEAANDEELAGQFARTAALAVEAGADIVEANLSCPNTGAGELICESPAASSSVVQAVAKELSESRTPLFIKISYLAPPLLEDLIRRCGRFVQGVVGINTVSVPVIRSGGEQFFEGRGRAGLSGAAIQSLALSVARQLVDLRERAFGRSDWAVIGVGGVTTPQDFDAFMDAGVDVVQSCSGAWLNPELALEIQGRESGGMRQSIPKATLPAPQAAPAVGDIPEGDQVALLSALDVAGELDLVEAAVAARLTPSSARAAQQILETRGWVMRYKGKVALTEAGRRVLSDMARGGASIKARERPVEEDVDSELDRAIQRLARR